MIVCLSKGYSPWNIIIVCTNLPGKSFSQTEMAKSERLKQNSSEEEFVCKGHNMSPFRTEIIFY